MMGGIVVKGDFASKILGKHTIILFEIFLTRSKKGHGSVSFLPFSLSSDAFLLDPIIASSCESLSHHLLTLLNFVKIGFLKVVTWIYLSWRSVCN